MTSAGAQRSTTSGIPPHGGLQPSSVVFLVAVTGRSQSLANSQTTGLTRSQLLPAPNPVSRATTSPLGLSRRARFKSRNPKPQPRHSQYLCPSRRESRASDRLYAGSGPGYAAGQAANNLGVAVGYRASSPTGGPDAAVLWWNHNAPTSVDLNSLSKTVPGGGQWDLRLASAINDNIWILGWGYKNGQPHAFLLKPQQFED